VTRRGAHGLLDETDGKAVAIEIGARHGGGLRVRFEGDDVCGADDPRRRQRDDAHAGADLENPVARPQDRLHRPALRILVVAARQGKNHPLGDAVAVAEQAEAVETKEARPEHPA